ERSRGAGASSMLRRPARAGPWRVDPQSPAGELLRDALELGAHVDIRLLPPIRTIRHAPDGRRLVRPEMEFLAATGPHRVRDPFLVAEVRLAREQTRELGIGGVDCAYHHEPVILGPLA